MNSILSIIVPVDNVSVSYLCRNVWSPSEYGAIRAGSYSIADDVSTDPAIRPILEYCSRRDARIRVVFRDADGRIRF